MTNHRLVESLWLDDVPVAVVDGVAETGRVDDAEAQLHATLPQHHLTRLHLPTAINDQDHE